MTVVELYVTLIHMGIKTIDNVPEMIKQQVEKLLGDDLETIKNNNYQNKEIEVMNANENKKDE